MNSTAAISEKIVGFSPHECLHFKGNNLYAVSLAFGAAMKDSTQQVLSDFLGQFSPTRRNKILERSQIKLGNLKTLAQSQKLAVGGVNWLARYLEALGGFCEGAGISEVEGALLQMEIEANCQTVWVQDKQTGEIRVLHTEEDADFSALTSKEYSYRLVSMQVGNQDVLFLAYPGLCGWGAAFGVNETAGLVQTIDDLLPREIYNQGSLWANALAFMTFDCSDISVIKELVKRLSEIHDIKFCGGYAIHLGQAAPQPAMYSIEFIDKQIKLLEPRELSDRRMIAQGNCPLDREIRTLSLAWPPTKGQKWNFAEAQIYVEMRERQKRLGLLAETLDWLKKSPQESITLGLQALASPEGDLILKSTPDSPLPFYLSGLPSKWTLAHFVAYISPQSLYFYIGKLLPTPIPGREYQLEVDINYPFAQKKLWEEAEKELTQFSSNNNY